MHRLLFTLLFGSLAYAQPSFNTPEDLTVFDTNNDGYALFDLTLNSPTLLNGLDTGTHAVTYHLTFVDADLNRNAILKPTSYTNEIAVSQELYARVTNRKDTSEYSVDLFHILTSGKNEKSLNE